MQYDVNNGLLQVVIEGEEINAVVGEAAQIDVGEAINYIQSGKAEIEEAVEEGITQFNENATEKTNEFDLNAQNKTSDFNSNATQKTLDFNSNASDKTSEFNLNAQDKTGDFNDNAVDKTNDFNDNATVKTIAFNENATSKTTAFNENASEKQALVDASAQAASQSAAEAKQWAIGDPSEPTGNSAKYWAEQSAGALSGLTTRVSTIEGKIPSAASSSNQLADKDWVENKGYITGITSGDVTTALGYTPYDSSNPDGYQTASDVVTAISGKQDTLVSGTNIKTINNNSILGSGNLDINGLPTQTGQSGKFLTTDGTDASWADVDALPSQTGQSGKYLTTDGSSASWATLSVNPDNKSITTNSSDELQTVGVINSRDSSTAVKTWTGTKAQYDAIVTKDPNTLYNITDDSQSGTDIYSKTEVDTLLNGKADTDLSNVLSNIDYVVESKYPTAADPTWYRVYKSGWVEQGGVQSSSSVTFMKEFADTKYFPQATWNDVGTGSGQSILVPSSTMTTGTMSVNIKWSSDNTISTFTGKTFTWEAKGMGVNQ